MFGNAIDFCRLIFLFYDLMILLNSLLLGGFCLFFGFVASLGFSAQLSENMNSFISSFLICVAFIFFIKLTATSNTSLRVVHYWFLRENTLLLSSILVTGFLWVFFIKLRKFNSISDFERFSHMKGYWSFSKAFSVFVNMTMQFFLSLFIQWIILAYFLILSKS